MEIFKWNCKNHCGYANHKLSFACHYDGEDRTTAGALVAPKKESLDYILHHLGLPCYATLVAREKRRITAIATELTSWMVRNLGQWSDFHNVWEDEKGSTICISVRQRNSVFEILVTSAFSDSASREPMVSTDNTTTKGLETVIMHIIAEELGLEYYC